MASSTNPRVRRLNQRLRVLQNGPNLPDQFYFGKASRLYSVYGNKHDADLQADNETDEYSTQNGEQIPQNSQGTSPNRPRITDPSPLEQNMLDGYTHIQTKRTANKGFMGILNSQNSQIKGVLRHDYMNEKPIQNYGQEDNGVDLRDIDHVQQSAKVRLNYPANKLIRPKKP
jgi:hypothetical protein